MKFDVVTGKQHKPVSSAPAYTKVFGQSLVKEAEKEVAAAVKAAAIAAMIRVFGIALGGDVLPYGTLGWASPLVVIAAVTITIGNITAVRQDNIKRMLAYSSVEHMGILVFGIGVGGMAGLGSLLHAVNHSLTKAMLFLTAGNLLALYRTKSTQGTGRLLERSPRNGLLWLAGFLAICGSPPFGPFLSELTILQGAMRTGHGVAAIGYLAALLTTASITSTALPP